MNFYGLFEILQLEFEDRLSPLISELCFLDAAVLIDVSKSIDTTERKKLKDFFNKIVDKMTVTWALSLLARMSLSYSYCTKKYHSADALNKRVADTIFHDSTKHGICTDLAQKESERGQDGAKKVERFLQ